MTKFPLSPNNFQYFEENMYKEYIYRFSPKGKNDENLDQNISLSKKRSGKCRAKNAKKIIGINK